MYLQASCQQRVKRVARYNALQATVLSELLTGSQAVYIIIYLLRLLHRQYSRYRNHPRMLRKNPATRITLEEVMRHEWITKEGLRLSRLEGNAKVTESATLSPCMS